MAKKPFQKGNKLATKNKGKLKKSTITKIQLGMKLNPRTYKKVQDLVKTGDCDIEVLKPLTTSVWLDLLTNKRTQAFAVKEISKYIYPQKRDMNLKSDEGLTININYKEPDKNKDDSNNNEKVI